MIGPLLLVEEHRRGEAHRADVEGEAKLGLEQMLDAAAAAGHRGRGVQEGEATIREAVETRVGHCGGHANRGRGGCASRLRRLQMLVNHVAPRVGVLPGRAGAQLDEQAEELAQTARQLG